MKRLSDYKNEDAIELWADLLDPIVSIFQDEEIRKQFSETTPMLQKAKTILKKHAREASDIILRIDPTPITGLNLLTRFVDILLDIEKSEEFGGFFGSAPQERTESESSGSATGNTEAEEI